MKTTTYQNNNFKYQDQNDEIFNLGQKKSHYPDSWNEGDNFALKIIAGNLMKYRIRAKNSTMLDAGAGTGYWSLALSGFFDKIVAVEPDGNQINHMKISLESKNVSGGKISIIQSPVQNFNYPGNFQFILCSHVIQHISKLTVDSVLTKLFHLLQRNGILALFTTHSQCDYTRYLLQYSASSEEFVSEETFENSFSNKNLNCFPTRKYSREDLFRLVQKIGFTILDDKIYHLPYLAPGSEEEMNASYIKKRMHGIDQILILTKY